MHLPHAPIQMTYVTDCIKMLQVGRIVHLANSSLIIEPVLPPHHAFDP
jgi:hypothetical protein